MNRLPKNSVTGRFQCEICSKVLFSTHAVWLHSRKHTKNRAKRRSGGRLELRCDICKGSIRGVITDYVDFKSAIVCPTCKELLYKKSEEERSFILDNLPGNEKESKAGLTCIDCQRWFPTSGALQSHMRTHIDPVKTMYVCKCGDEELKTLQALKEHLRMHPGKTRREKLLKCDVCKDLFSSVKKYKKHMNNHNEEKTEDNDEEVEQPFKLKCCKPNCLAVYLDKRSFRNHQLFHQYAKYQCDLCQKLYGNIHSYRQHKC